MDVIQKEQIEEDLFSYSGREGQESRVEKKATDIHADTLTNPTQTKKEVGQTKGQVSYWPVLL